MGSGGLLILSFWWGLLRSLPSTISFVFVGPPQSDVAWTGLFLVDCFLNVPFTFVNLTSRGDTMNALPLAIEIEFRIIVFFFKHGH